MKKFAILLTALASIALSACSRDEQSASSQAAIPTPASYQSQSVQITSMKQGWTGTGLQASPGDELTITATGQIELGLVHPVEPRHGLWGRVGEAGTIFQLASNQYSFTTEEAGELYVAISPTGLLWANRQGDWLELFEQMPDSSQMVDVEAFLWTGSAEQGLTKMLDDPDRSELASQSLATIRETKTLPDGYEYLWYLAQSNVFEGFSDGERHGVHAATDDDYGIIRKEVDIPLTPTTQINFDWLYQHLPALASESSPASHDYLSIALEFDNGQDITWMWSKDLAPGTIMKCPMPEWHHRETHMVLQSGTEGLGQWHSHTRSVEEDYIAAVGGELPTRIVGVWIIGVALFGGQPAEAYFANAVVSDGDAQYPLM
jgi:hypothetical protein